MFSLACSALLEPGPEKLSVSCNPSLYIQHHGWGKKTNKNNENLIKITFFPLENERMLWQKGQG